jgi:hypothetical protein
MMCEIQESKEMRAREKYKPYEKGILQRNAMNKKRLEANRRRERRTQAREWI